MSTPSLSFSPKQINHFLSELSVNLDINIVKFITGVLEYITAELLELSGSQAFEEHMKEINNRHLNRAIIYDDELKVLFPGTPKISNKRFIGIERVLSEVQPNHTICSGAIINVNALTYDILKRLASYIRARDNITIEVIEEIINNIFPGELAPHAISEGRKAMR